VEPLAARVAHEDTRQLHHFIGGSPWPAESLEAVLVAKATRWSASPPRC
jgi:hypothetical protein